MPLNLGRRRNASSGDDYIPQIRYAAKTDTWSTWDDVTKEMTKAEFFATVDLATIRTGWLKFAAGEPPDLIWDENGKAQPRPDKDYRRGFSVLVVLEGFGLRELCSNSAGMCAAISAAFDEYEQAPEAKQGLLPVLGTSTATKVAAPTGDYFEPHFQLGGWEQRPPELPTSRPPVAASSTSSTRSTAVVARIEDTLDDEIPY